MIQRIKQWIREEAPFALGVPPFLWQFLFVFVPLVLVVAISFVVTKNGWITITTQYFTHLFDWPFAVVIGRSLALAINTSIITVILGYPVAYYIAFKSTRYKYILLYFLIIPFWTNFLFHAFAWSFILERQGVLNSILHGCGIISEPIHFLNTTFAVYIMMVYSYFPFMVLPIYTALEKIPKQFLEVSYDLGATWGQTFWRIIFPLSISGVQAGFFLVFIPAFGEFAVPELLGGDKTMYVGSVISHYILNAWTQSIGAAFTLLSAAVLLLASLVVLFVMRRLGGIQE